MREEYGEINCISCKYHGDKCKRINHSTLKFYKPYFAAYNSSGCMGEICKEFYPAGYCVWLKAHWKGVENFYTLKELTEGTIAVIYKGTPYHIRKKDFYEGNIFSENNELNWLDTWTYKRYRGRFGRDRYKVIRRSNENRDRD